MCDLIERDKIYEAVYDLACKSVGVIGGISEDYACGLREAAHKIDEAQAVDAVTMTHDLNRSDLIRRNDVLWITKETGAWETQNRVRELPAVDAAPVVHGRWRQDDEDAWTCTACGNMWTFLDGGPNENNAKYCPMCGAKMDVEGDVKCQN